MQPLHVVTMAIVSVQLRKMHSSADATKITLLLQLSERQPFTY